MLTLHVLNVGHGSSTVIEYSHPSRGKIFGLVDSNAHAKEEPKALRKLKSLGASELSFVLLTHPHRDHFSGLMRTINAMGGKIGHFYTPPLGDLLNNKKRLKAVIEALKKYSANDNSTIRSAHAELIDILMWAYQFVKCGGEWHECSGDANVLGPDGFSGVEVTTIIPEPRVKGDFFTSLDKGEPWMSGRIANEVSLAVSLKYQGHTLVIGGDATSRNWTHRRRFEQSTNTHIGATAVVLPHHGSRYDCDREALQQLYESNASTDRFGISSGDGEHHPDQEVIEWLQTSGIKPYCTNLIPQCGAHIKKLNAIPNLDPVLANWVREMSISKNHQAVCQGDITISIGDTGAVTVTTEEKNFCAYRGDYKGLL